MKKLDRSTADAIKGCHQYFRELDLEDSAPNPTIQDSDGLVSYVNASANNPPKELMEEYRKISSILEGFTGIITAAALKIAGNDTAKKHASATWNEPLSQIVKAFFGPYKNEEQHQNKEVVGLTIATHFIEILLAAVVNQGAALVQFQKFLQAQGETMRIEAGGSSADYRYACIGMAHEIFEIEPGEWLYVPKLNYYFTSFSQETWHVTSACASADHFKFDFKLQNLAAAFRLEYWRQNEEFRKEVDRFISKYTKANIAESENYFDGIFESKPADGMRLDLLEGRVKAIVNRDQRFRQSLLRAAR